MSLLEESLFSRVLRGVVATLSNDDGDAKRKYKGPASDRQRVLRGNIISFPLDPGSSGGAMAQLDKVLAETSTLPRNISEGLEVLQVEFYGNYERKAVATDPALQQLARVRKAVVLRCLETLKQLDPSFQNCNIANADALNSLPEDDIPPAFWSSAFQWHASSTASSIMQVDTSGYVNLPGSGKGVGGITSSGLVDMSGVTIQADAVLCKVLSNLTNGNEIKLNVGVENVPVNEYGDVGKLLRAAFPTLFPYGCGMPTWDKTCSGIYKPIPFDKHIRHLFGMKYRRFARHRLFPFALLNMMQRQSICRSVKALVPTNLFAPSESADLTSVTPAQIESVITSIRGGRSVKQAIQGSPPGVRKLLKVLKIGGGSIKGAFQLGTKNSKELRSYMNVLGQPNLYVTINPNDFTQPLLVRWATGLHQAADDDVPEFMEKINGLRVVAENPDVAARVFHHIMCAFFACLVCCRTAGGGVFGDIIGYYACPECQGRGTLHCHIVLWLRGAGSTNGLVSALNSDEFKSRFLTFINAICARTVSLQPSSTNTGSDDAPCDEPRTQTTGGDVGSTSRVDAPVVQNENDDVAATRAVLTDCDDNSNSGNENVEAVDTCCTCVSRSSNNNAKHVYKNTLSFTSASSLNELQNVPCTHDSRRYMTRKVGNAQTRGGTVRKNMAPDTLPQPRLKEHPSPESRHVHPVDNEFYESTRFRNELLHVAQAIAYVANMHEHRPTCYKNGKLVCRFGYPQELVPRTLIDNETYVLHILRNHEWINGYNPATMIALRCNMDIK